MKKFSLILFSIIALLTIVLFVIFNFFIFKRNYTYFVKKYSAEYFLEEEFVYAIIKAESDFDERAVSKSGAMGLMQIIPSTAKWIASELNETYSKENMFSSEINIKYGCFYLNYLFSKFNNIDVVICAYNAGETVVRDWLDQDGELIENKISYPETRTYYSRVKTFYEGYKNMNL